MKRQQRGQTACCRVRGGAKRAGWLSLLAMVGGVLLLSSCAALLKPDGDALHSSDATHLHDAVVDTPRVEQLGHGPYARYVVCAGTACPSRTRKTLFVPPSSSASSPEPSTAPVVLPQASGAAATPEPAPIESTEPTESIEISTVVRFDVGQSVLSSNAKSFLSSAVARAESTSGSRRLKVDILRVVGRTDSVGRQDMNDGLALARARAVRDYVLSRLHDLPSKIDLEAKGACCYAASNKTAGGRKINRRVELIFVRKELAVGAISSSPAPSSSTPSTGLSTSHSAGPPPDPPSDATPSGPDTADPFG